MLMHKLYTKAVVKIVTSLVGERALNKTKNFISITGV